MTNNSSDLNVAVASAQMKYNAEKKRQSVAWLLWWFTGVFGGHRYYMGDTRKALKMTFTLGGLGVWALIDGFKINGDLSVINDVICARVFAQAYQDNWVPETTVVPLPPVQTWDWNTPAR